MAEQSGDQGTNVSRRALLGGAAAFALGTALPPAVEAAENMLLPELYPETHQLEEVARELLPPPDVAPAILHPDQSFTKSNTEGVERVLDEAQRFGRIHIVVHPGFQGLEARSYIETYGDKRRPVVPEGVRYPGLSDQEVVDSGRQRIRDLTAGFSEEGDYGEYWERLNSLLRHLDESGEPTIILIEKRVFEKRGYNYPDMVIPRKALILVTDPADPSLAPKVVRGRRDGEESRWGRPVVSEDQLDISKLSIGLADRGVRDVRVAGEDGVSLDRTYSPGEEPRPACLGSFVQWLQDQYDHFDVTGYAGLSFPTRPTTLSHPNDPAFLRTMAEHPEKAAVIAALYREGLPEAPRA